MSLLHVALYRGKGGYEANRVSLCDQRHLLTNEPNKGISTF